MADVEKQAIGAGAGIGAEKRSRMDIPKSRDGHDANYSSGEGNEEVVVGIENGGTGTGSPGSVSEKGETSGKKDQGEENSEKKEEEPKPEFGPFMKIFRYGTLVDKLLHTFGFLAAVGAGAALPLMTLVFGELVNIFTAWSVLDANGNRSLTPAALRAEINKNALWFVYLFLGKFVLVYIHTTSYTISATRIVRQLRLRYVQSILRQDIAYFDTCSPGSVATRISTNANLIQAGISEKIGVALQSFSMLITAFIIAFIKDWKLTLVTATTVPAAVIAVGITVVIDGRLEKEILGIQAVAGGLAEEVLGSVRNVVAFDAGGVLGRKYAAMLARIGGIGKKRGPVLGMQYSSEFFTMYCAYALCFWYGIRLLTQGDIADGGTIVTVFFNVIIATSSLTMIAPSIGAFTKAAAASADVLIMLEKEPKIDSSSEAGLRPEVAKGSIELRNISFYYPARPSVKVLDDISLAIPENKVTALVGASGSGKSTIVGLLERWYDPAEEEAAGGESEDGTTTTTTTSSSTTRGQVLFDGIDARDLNLKWLRTQIGLVQQEPVLFNDTVYENVAHGLAGTPLDHEPEAVKRSLVEKACIEANADIFIRQLPQGYDTKVGERAGLLSGGQKQRIAIARSIIKDPKILLLDEATSALDPRSEAVVQAALDRACMKRTTVMIAHKLSTVRKADNIVVMKKGRIIEQGTHEGLLGMRGAYWRLVNAQSLGVGGEGGKLRKEEKEKDTARDGDSVDGEDDDGDSDPENREKRELERVETMRSVRSAAEQRKSEEDVSRKLSLLKCLAIIFSEQRKHWPWYLSGFMASVCAGAVFPVQAVLFSEIVGVFALVGDALTKEGNFWALMFFILALGTLLSYAGLGFSLTVFGVKIEEYYRNQYFSSMVSQDISFFDHEDNTSGSLASRLSLHPTQLNELISGNIGLIMIVFVNLVGSCVLAIAVGWKLGLVAVFGCLPPIFAAGFVRLRLEMKFQDSTAKFFLESARFASEAVGAIRTVSSLTLESKVNERYRQQLYGPVQRTYKQTAIAMIFFGLSESIDMLGMGLAFWYGGRLMSFEEYDTKKFFIVFIAVVFGGQAAGYMFAYTANFTKAHAAANHILHLREQPIPINSSTGTPLPELPPADSALGATPAIEFRNVKFSYPSRPHLPVLRGVSLKIFPGQTIGLVGPSGCGKTTIVSLLERFYDVSSGTILIHDTPLTTLDVRNYRSSISLVSQEPTLYQGTIKENILLGLANFDSLPPGTLEQKLITACESANIHSFITSLPEGYNTDVGSKGLALSGGQRQRIAIARALIRDPRILLLDEATSALDTESEKIVQEALERASKGRTTIAVAHRLSTIRHADCIFVFEGGRIVEAGGHAELLEKGGVYYEMCMGQGLDREV